MDEKIITGVIANPRVMRSMPQLLRDAGIKLVDSRSWVLTEIGVPTSVLVRGVTSILLPRPRRGEN